MLKNLILIVMIFVVYRIIKQMLLDPMKKDNNPYPLEKNRGESADDLMIKDPECGVYFPQRQGISLRVDGQTLYFCSEKCRDDYKSKMP
jgi:YHS domain-containing protein